MKAMIRYVIERNNEVVIQRKTCGRFWSVLCAMSIPFGGILYATHVIAWAHDWKLMDNELYANQNKQNRLARDLKAAIAKEKEIKDKLNRVKDAIKSNGDKRKAISYFEPVKLRLGELIFRKEPFKTPPKETWRDILKDNIDNVHSTAEGMMARTRRNMGKKDPHKDLAGKSVTFGAKDVAPFMLDLQADELEEFVEMDMTNKGKHKGSSKKNRHKGETDEQYAARMAQLNKSS